MPFEPNTQLFPERPEDAGKGYTPGFKTYFDTEHNGVQGDLCYGLNKARKALLKIQFNIENTYDENCTALIDALNPVPLGRCNLKRQQLFNIYRTADKSTLYSYITNGEYSRFVSRKCKAGIFYNDMSSRHVHFCLAELNIEQALRKGENDSTTSKELRYIYRNREDIRFQSNIQFWDYSSEYIHYAHERIYDEYSSFFGRVKQSDNLNIDEYFDAFKKYKAEDQYIDEKKIEFESYLFLFKKIQLYKKDNFVNFLQSLAANCYEYWPETKNPISLFFKDTAYRNFIRNRENLHCQSYLESREYLSYIQSPIFFIRDYLRDEAWDNARNAMNLCQEKKFAPCLPPWKTYPRLFETYNPKYNGSAISTYTRNEQGIKISRP